MKIKVVNKGKLDAKPQPFCIDIVDVATVGTK